MLVVAENACPFEAVPTWFLDVLRALQQLASASGDEAEPLAFSRGFTAEMWWRVELRVRQHLAHQIAALFLEHKPPLHHLGQAVSSAMIADELRGDGDWSLARREYDTAEYVCRADPCAESSRHLAFASALICLAPGLGRPRDHSRHYHTCCGKLAYLAPDARPVDSWLDGQDVAELRHLTSIVGIFATPFAR